MSRTKTYTIFNNYKLKGEEEKLDNFIKLVERESIQLSLFGKGNKYDSELSHAVREHSYKLMSNLRLKIYDPSDVPAEGYIKILEKYNKAFSLVRNPYASITIEMKIKDNIHRIWKDISWVAEKLPKEIEEFGLVHDYPSDFLQQYDEIKRKEKSELSEKQGMNLERTWWGSFHIYIDYFRDLNTKEEFLQRPGFIVNDYREICDNEEKFVKVIYSMNGSLKYASYLDPDTLRWKISTLVVEALTEKQEFVDNIPKELENLVDEQIMFIIENSSKKLGEVIYEPPLSYRDKVFLSVVDEALSEDKLYNKEFWNWLFKRVGYERNIEKT